jgi:hypothetical protein
LIATRNAVVPQNALKQANLHKIHTAGRMANKSEMPLESIAKLSHRFCVAPMMDWMHEKSSSTAAIT